MKKNIFNNRRFKHGSLATVMTVGLVVAVVLVNLIASLLVERFPMDIDLTDDKIFELSTESTDYVKALTQSVDVTILATEESFAGNNEYYNQANEVINKYSQYTGNLKISYVDIYTDPAFAQKYPKETLSYGSIIVSCGDRYQILTAYDLFNVSTDQQTGNTTIASSKAEQAMTSAIMFVTDANPITATILTGYGSTGVDLAGLQNLLKSNGYLVTETNLMTEEIAPEVTLAVLAAPTADLTTEVVEKLSNYLENDGKFNKNFYYFADARQPKLPLLEEFLTEWGVGVGEGYLAETDTSKVYFTPTYLMQQYDNTDYMEELISEQPMLLADCRPLEVLFENSSNRSTKVMLKSYESAVTVPADADDNWTVEQGEKAVYPTAVLGQRLAYEGTTPKVSSVMVFGSVAMIDEGFLNMAALNNADYMLNMSNKLTNKAKGVSIISKTLGTKTLGISQEQAVGIGGAFQYGLPVLVLLCGGFIWMRRRNR